MGESTEQAFLSAIMNDRAAFDTVHRYIDKAGSKLFSDQKNRNVFEAIRSIAGNGDPVDLVSVMHHLRESKKLESSGGSAYVSGLYSSFVSAANTEYYARLLFEGHLRREIQLMSDFMTRSVAAKTDVFDVADIVMGKMQEALSGIAEDNVYRLETVLRGTVDDYKLAIDQGGLAGVSSGISRVDEYVGGWRPGDLIIVGARPGKGKTNVALKFAREGARNLPVLFISIEMQRSILGQRIVATEAGFDDVKLRTGRLSGDEEVSLLNTVDSLISGDGKRYFICDSSSLSIRDIEVLIRRMVREQGIKLVVIDYLQLVTPSSGAGNREQAVADISKRLKAAAKENNVPIIALAQVNRESAKAGDEPPKVHHLKESGQIEQDADVIILLHAFCDGQPGVVPAGYGEFSGQPAQGLLFMEIAKQRNGGQGWIFLNFEKSCGRLTQAKLDSRAMQSTGEGGSGSWEWESECGF